MATAGIADTFITLSSARAILLNDAAHAESRRGLRFRESNVRAEAITNRPMGSLFVDVRYCFGVGFAKPSSATGVPIVAAADFSAVTWVHVA
jgi:hypothetical protein